MSNDEKYLVAFELISIAGDSKNCAFQAIAAAREKDFAASKKYLSQAETKMRTAHEKQLNLIQQEISGESVDVNIMLVHAQDHLSMAIMMKDIAEELIHVYGNLYQQKNE